MRRGVREAMALRALTTLSIAVLLASASAPGQAQGLDAGAAAVSATETQAIVEIHAAPEPVGVEPPQGAPSAGLGQTTAGGTDLELTTHGLLDSAEGWSVAVQTEPASREPPTLESPAIVDGSTLRDPYRRVHAEGESGARTAWTIAVDGALRSFFYHDAYVPLGCPDCTCEECGEPGDPLQPTWDAINAFKRDHRGNVFDALAMAHGILWAALGGTTDPPTIPSTGVRAGLPALTVPSLPSITVPGVGAVPTLTLNVYLRDVAAGIRSGVRAEALSPTPLPAIWDRGVGGAAGSAASIHVEASADDAPMGGTPVASAAARVSVAGVARTGGADAPAAAGGPAPAWAAGVWFVLALLALFPFLHRLRSASALLCNEVRKEVYALAAERGGVTPAEVARRLGISDTTASYHLRLLRRHGVLSSHAVGKRILFHPNGSGGSPDERTAEFVLRQATPRRVLLAIAHDPRVPLRELASAAGLTISGVYWYVNRLEAQGLLVTRRSPRRGITYAVSPHALALLRGDEGSASAEAATP